jgi:hypothetical protein
MSEISKIYEISRQLSSPENLKDDFNTILNEITDLITKHFSTKYLTPVNIAVSSHKQYCSTHPSKEVNLLQALKPFFNNPVDEKHLNKMIDAVNVLRLFTFVSSNGDTRVNAASISDNAIHSDGIYEVDESCINADTQTFDNFLGIDTTALILALFLFMLIK